MLEHAPSSTPSTSPRLHRHLPTLAVASPCHERWEDMQGDDKRRFCGRCEKHVHNLSAMPPDEAEALLTESDLRVCVRFYRRSDGTVITGDCPVGVRRKRKSLAFAMAATVLGGITSLLGCTPESKLSKVHQHVDSRAYTDEVVEAADAGGPEVTPVAGGLRAVPPPEMTMGEPMPPQVSKTPAPATR